MCDSVSPIISYICPLGRERMGNRTHGVVQVRFGRHFAFERTGFGLAKASHVIFPLKSMLRYISSITHWFTEADMHWIPGKSFFLFKTLKWFGFVCGNPGSSVG